MTVALPLYWETYLWVRCDLCRFLYGFNRIILQFIESASLFTINLSTLFSIILFTFLCFLTSQVWWKFLYNLVTIFESVTELGLNTFAKHMMRSSFISPDQLALPQVATERVNNHISNLPQEILSSGNSHTFPENIPFCPQAKQESFQYLSSA